MKNIILTIGITILKIFANIFYFIVKIFPVQNKILMITRQSDNPTLDFRLLEKKIKEIDPSIQIKMQCKAIESNALYKSGFKYKMKYCIYILKIICDLATARVCILDGYCIPVSILKHKKKLKIIQIWHASGAVKKFGYQILNKKEGSSSKIAKLMCMHKNYDYVIAPSEETRKFYTEAFNVPSEKIVKFGLPRLEYIANSKYNKEEIFNDYPYLREKKNIVYIPTFRKNKNIKIDEILKCKIDEEKYNLIISIHPLDNTEIPKKYLVDKKYSSFDLIKMADYIITDYSIISIEASVLNKPIFLYLYDYDEYENERGLNIKINKELETFTSNNFNDIMTKIEKKDYNMDEIEKYKEKYIEINPNSAIEELSRFILKVYKEQE